MTPLLKVACRNLNITRVSLEDVLLCAVSIGIADYLGSILSYVILAIPVFSGIYDHLSPPDLSAFISRVLIYSVVLAPL